MRIKNSINLIKSICAVEEKPELRPVKLRDVVLTEASGYNNVEINVNIPEMEVLADALLASVFRNPIINAIVHSDEKNPKIEITAKKFDGWVEIRVADNGPGIPDWMKEEVFKEGFGEYTGLGLYLVKKIVESVFVIQLKLA